MIVYVENPFFDLSLFAEPVHVGMFYSAIAFCDIARCSNRSTSLSHMQWIQVLNFFKKLCNKYSVEVAWNITLDPINISVPKTIPKENFRNDFLNLSNSFSLTNNYF